MKIQKAVQEGAEDVKSRGMGAKTSSARECLGGTRGLRAIRIEKSVGHGSQSQEVRGCPSWMSCAAALNVPLLLRTAHAAL